MKTNFGHFAQNQFLEISLKTKFWVGDQIPVAQGADIKSPFSVILTM